MEEIELQAVLDSGEVVQLLIGGIEATDKAITKAELNVVDAKVIAVIAGTKVISKTTYDATLVNPAHTEGAQFYDKEKKAVSYYTDIPDVTANGVLEDLARVEANAGVLIPNGTPLYFEGTLSASDIPRVAIAKADALNTGEVRGVATHDIANGTEGWATTRGRVGGIDLETLTETGITLATGDVLFLSGSEPGKYTNVPADLATSVGVLFKMSTPATADGILYVKIHSLYHTPTIHAALIELVTPTLVGLTVAPVIITGYGATSHGVLLPYNVTSGEISIVENGVYDIFFGCLLTLDALNIPAQNSYDEILVEIYDINDAGGLNIQIPCHFSEFQDNFLVQVHRIKTLPNTAGLKARISSPNNTVTITLNDIVFDITSRHLN